MERNSTLPVFGDKDAPLQKFHNQVYMPTKYVVEKHAFDKVFNGTGVDVSY